MGQVAIKVRVVDKNSQERVIRNVDHVETKNEYTEVYTDTDVIELYHFPGRVILTSIYYL